MNSRSVVTLMLSSLVTMSLAAAGHAQAPGVTPDTVTVGAILDMSGPVVIELTQQYYGQLAYVQKAFDEGIYKRKIKIVAEDGGYDPAKHLAAGKLLLDRDNVFCFVNSVGTSPTIALNELLEARKVPLVSPSAQSNRLAVPFKRYIFNQMAAYYDQARICVDYIVSKDPKARIAMICQDDDFGHEGRDGFLEQCKKHGIEPVGVVTYQRGAKDLSSPVIKLKSLNPDYVINHGIAAPGAAIMKEAQKLSWRPKWVVMSGLPVGHFIQLSGEALDFAGDIHGVMLNYLPDGDSPGAVEYREAVKKYQPKAETNNSNSMWGYGYSKVLVEGLKRAEAANDLTREGLIKALETLKDFETGVFPPITYTSTSHSAPASCMLVKRSGASWVAVTGEWIKAK
ncbi:MAG: ABC transporter substrate-binding protein [Thermodesulfobacteriota bacterium]